MNILLGLVRPKFNSIHLPNQTNMDTYTHSHALTHSHIHTYQYYVWNAVRDFITLFTKYNTYLFYVIILRFYHNTFL